MAALKGRHGGILSGVRTKVDTHSATLATLATLPYRVSHSYTRVARARDTPCPPPLLHSFSRVEKNSWEIGCLGCLGWRNWLFRS